MNSPLLWVSVSYMVSIFLFFSQNSTLILWCLLEVNMVLFISLLYFLEDCDKMLLSEQCFFYFLVQSIGSFLFLLSVKFSNLMCLSGLSEFLLVMSIVTKMGLWPASAWVYQLSASISRFKIFILLSFQKVPFLYIIFMFPSLYSYIFLLASFLAGSIYIFESMSLCDLLISSSIYSTVWVGYLFSSSFLCFLLYLCVYFLFLFILLEGSLSSSPDKVSIFLSFLFFLGLPPLSLFFFKLFVINWMSGALGYADLLIFWGLSFFGLFGYAKMFFEHLFTKFFMYLNNEFLFKKMSFFLFPCSFFYLFLV